MPLTYALLAHMQSEMLGRYDLRALEVRLSGENLSQLQRDVVDSPIALRYMAMPRNVVEFFVPDLRRTLSTWQDFDAYHGGSFSPNLTTRSFPIEVERDFTHDGESFTCRLSFEPVPAVPRVRLPDVPSLERSLRAFGEAMNQIIPPVNLATLMTQRLAASIDDDIVEATVAAFEALHPKKLDPPPPANRIDFLLEVIDDGVDEPHAED